MAQSNSFLRSPFDDIAAQTPQDDSGLLPGQQPVKATPQVEMQPARRAAQPQEAAPVPEAAPSAADQPAPAPRRRAENWLPPADQMPIFEAAAQHFNVPVNALMALSKQESSYRPDAIGVPTKWGRAKGIMQYLDSTAQGLGINPFDPAEAIPAAAKQLRERLDAGASLKDAVMEHFAGPDRKLWGAKTAAYGDEVMAKVNRIGQLYTGGAQGSDATQPEATKPDLAAMQQQLDAEEPGRYKVLPEGYAEQHFSAAMPRDTYEQTFRSVNPGASDAAIANAMQQYDEQAKARAAMPAPTPAEDRFKALQQTPEAQFDAKLNQKLQGQPNGIVPPLPAKMQPELPAAYDAAAAAKESTLGAAASYLGKSFKAGMYDLAGAGAKVLDEINPWTLSPSDAAVLFKDDPAKLKQFQDDSAAMILSRFAKRMTKNSDESMQEISDRAKRDYGSLEYATTDTGKAAYLSPTKVIGDAIRSLPTSAAMALSVYLTRGAAARAEQTALAAGMTEEAARQAAVAAGAKAMATTGAASEGVTGYAQQANQSAADAEKVPMSELAKSPKFQQLLQQGFTPETARAKIIADTGEEAGRMAGIVDAAVNHVGGEFLGKILTEGGKLIPRIMKGAANESATEFVQSAGEQLGQNKATRDNINPNQSLTEGVGEAAIAGAAVGGVMGGGMAGAGGKGHSEAAPAPAAQPAPSVPAAQPQPAPIVAAGTAPVAQASAAPGPLSRSLENAAEQHGGQQNRVTATAPTGEQVSGQVQGYHEDADGNFVAQIVGDDGVVRTLDSRTGVQIEAEATPDAGPLTASLSNAAEQHAAEQPAAVPEPVQAQPAPAVAEMPATEATAPKPAPTIAEMTDQQLSDRLKYIASQAKDSGWDKRFVEARRAVESEIKKRATAAPTTEVSNVIPANDGRGSDSIPARNGPDNGGRSGADRPLPGDGRADAGLDGKQAATDLPAASGAVDAQHALKNPYQAYSAVSAERAQAYMDKRGADPAKFEVKQTGPVRWQVVPKQAAAPLTEIDAAAHEAATSPLNDKPVPTEAQQEAGNYTKGHITLHGMDISVENPRGSTRSGKREDGSTWSHDMSDHYGYIKRTTGADGEQVDVYVGPKPESQRVYVVDQLNQQDGSFDEHKAMLGYTGRDKAVAAYRSNFDKGWKVGPVKGMSVDEFKIWLEAGDTTKPVSEAKNTSPEAMPAAPAEGRQAGKPGAGNAETAEGKVAPAEKMIQTVAGPMTVDAYADLPVNERPARTGGVGSSNAAEANARAEQDAQEAAAKKDANRDKSIQQRRADSILDKPTRFPPSAGLGAGSRRDSMRMAVEQERAIVEKQVSDDAARKTDKEAIDRMTRAGYMIDHSNPNIPKVKAAREARDRLKANKYTKPEYRVYNGRDTNGSFFIINKTEFDYAQALKTAEKVPEVAPAEQQAAPVATDAKAGSAQPAPVAKPKQEPRRKAKPEAAEPRYSVSADDERIVTTEQAAAYEKAITEGRKRDAMRMLHEAVGVEQRDASLDRGGLHAPSGPEDGAPLFDVARGIYPEDIYSANGLRYYGTGNDKMDAEAYRLIKHFEAHPNMSVTIYRAVEKDGAKKILPGDWVTPIRAYAQEHGEANITGDFKIIKQLVYARDIFTSGDSWLEWGYHPQEFAPELPKGENKNRPLQALVDAFAKRGQPENNDGPRYSMQDGTPQAEFGPVHTEYRDDAAGAVERLMADKDGEAIVHRDDVGDISLVYGDGNMGLSHIAKRRGAEFMDRLPGLLSDGTLYSKPGQKDRVFIGTDRDEAVLRFEWDGKAKTWLLSAYEKYPDLKPAGDVQESRRSQVVDERTSAPIDKDALRQAVTRGVLGKVVDSMIDAGVVVLHDSPKTLPRNAGQNVKGVQAVTMPDGKIHLVASNLTVANANAVMLHEAFHQGADKLLGTEQWGALMGRMGSLYRQGQDTTGKAGEFWEKARARVAAAKAKGGVSTKMEVEEFAAYAIEEYESAPATIKKWVDDLLGMVKAWLVKRFGKQIGDVTPAQLSAFAKWAVMDHAVERRGEIFGDHANWFSLTDDTRTTTAPAAPQEPNRYTPAEQGLARRTQAAIQDNLNRVTQVQDKIKEVTGRTALGKADYRAAEMTRPGRIAARLEDAQDKLTGPLMEELAKSGHTPAQLSELLHAQHAEERNEAVARINPDMPDGGSGMTNDQAQAIIENYKDAAPLQALAVKARAIAKATLDLKLAYGLIKPADHEMLSTMYENYVPLKGDGEYGPKIKRATGHESRDEHILENIARDYDQAVVTGEKNLARQSLLQMVLKFPDEELWTAGLPPRGRYVAGKAYSVEKNGKSEAVFSSMSQVSAFLEAKGAAASNYTVLDSAGERVVEFTKPLQDNEVMVYVNGDPVRLQIHDEKLAAQLRPLNQDQMGPILSSFRKMNRYLSSIYTGYNPAFILRNASRDAITGTINMLGNEGAAVAAKAWGKYPAAVAALGQWATTKKAPDSKAGRYLTEYRMHGGKTGASHMSDLEQQGEKLQFMYDKTRGLLATAADGGMTKDGIKRTSAVAWNKTIGRLAHVIEIANQATENGLRLGLYMALREEGISADRAAQAAKGVTVDFDRKGASTGALGAIYLFFNPAVQGTANAMKTLIHGEHKAQAWAALGGLAAAGFLAASKGMDDDKDRWLGEGWDTRTKNLIINTPGHQFRAPMSQEFAPAYAFGVAMAEASRGESKTRTAARLVSSFIDAYFPLQGAYREESDNHLADMAQAATPTVIKPLIESAMNRNSFGSQVVPESELTKDKPDNLKMNRSTKNTAYDKAAQGIASAGEIFGAGKYENDITKISPETLKSLWRTYTGGLGQFITDSAGVATMAGKDMSQVEASDVPIIKDFYRPSTVNPVRSRYYDLSKEAKAAITEFDQAKKLGDGDELAKIADGEKGKLIGLGRMVRATSKAAAALGDQKVEVVANKDLSDAEKRAELKRIEAEEEDLYRSGIEVFK